MTSGVAWQAVPGECRRHRLQLQPVISFSFAFLCLGCGWYVEVGYHKDLYGQSWEGMAERLVGQVVATYAQECEYAGAYPVNDETWPEVCAKLGIEWPCRVPASEFTDDEWVRAMLEFQPDADPASVEAAVYRWRKEASHGEEAGPGDSPGQAERETKA